MCVWRATGEKERRQSSREPLLQRLSREEGREEAWNAFTRRKMDTRFQFVAEKLFFPFPSPLLSLLAAKRVNPRS